MNNFFKDFSNLKKIIPKKKKLLHWVKFEDYKLKYI